MSVLPVIVLIALISLNVIIFGTNTLSGANQIALLFSAAVASIISIALGVKWKTVRKHIVHHISSAMPSILILLLIGSLAGTWMLSGVVPSLIFYGLKIIEPKVFLITSVIICALVSLATGSSWSTVATIGIALLGIGTALGINPGVIAGAIISGAYFGDKISPLSDTTNLAPAMAGTDLFTHIKYMLYTTVPSLVITLLIFTGIGLFSVQHPEHGNIQNVYQAISGQFFISPVLFIVPALLIFVIVRKIAPLPSLFIGIMAAVLCAVIFQPETIREVAGIEDNYGKAVYLAVMKSLFGEVSYNTADPVVNDLISTFGMAGMLNTIWLILSAMVFGGAMDASGMLVRISEFIISRAKGVGGMVSATAGTCVFFNVTASDQYISIVVPGKMFAKVYCKRGLKPEVLSRTLEDSGTVTSVLVPWNTCGATQAAVLGVATLSYLPYTFFCLISPFMTIFMAFFNIKIRRTSEKDNCDEEEFAKI